MKRKYIYLFFLIFVIQSCETDCYTGNKTSEEEAFEIIKENEFNDPLFTAGIKGDLSCLDNTPMTGLSVSIQDDYGYEFILKSDALGHFDLPYIQAGKYILKFSNPNLPIFNAEELDTIISRLERIVFGLETPTNIDRIAYDLMNYNNGLTTVDLLLFKKLRDGDIDIYDISFPWRYVYTDGLGQTQEINDSFIIDLKIAQKLKLNITPIYFGDPLGQFCN